MSCTEAFPLNRLLLLAYEQDQLLKRRGDGSRAKQLQLVLAKSLGDSRLVEMGHQHSKDLLRSAKQSTFTNTSIMSKLLQAQTLDKRGVKAAKASVAAKVEASMVGTKIEAVTKSLKAAGHKLPKQIQDLMVSSPCSPWPSPNPASLFQSLAGTKWLLHFWNNKDSLPQSVNANTSWMSTLAMPGTCMAQQSTGSLVLVVAAAEYAFLAWELSVEVHSEQRIFVCKPKRSCLSWRHIIDLSDWKVLPTQPLLISQHQGPIGWENRACSYGLRLRKQVILESHKRTVKARGDQEGDGLDAAWQQHGVASYKCSVGSQMTFNCWKWWGGWGTGFTTVTCDFPVCLWVGGRIGNTTRSMPVLLAGGAFEASPLTPEQLANMAKEARAKAKALAEPVLVYDLWSVWGSLQCLVCYDVCFAM